MTNNFENSWFLKVSELESVNQTSLKDYERLHRQLLHLDLALMAKREEVSRLSREIAVTDRQIKDTKHHNFLVHKKLTDMGETLTVFVAGFEKKRAELIRLDSKKQTLETRIKALQETIPKTVQELVDSKKKNKLTQKQIEERVKKEKNLTDEIAHFLSNTSIKREEFEKKAEQLNTQFIQSITERRDVNYRLKQVKKDNGVLSGVMDTFRTQIAQLIEIKQLKQGLPSKEKENQALEITYAERQVEARNKTNTANILLAEVNGLKEKISLFIGDNVQKLDAALSMVNQLDRESEAVAEERELALGRLFDLMIEKAGLEENPGVILERLDRLDRECADALGKELN